MAIRQLEKRPVIERFNEKYVVDENGCWVWQGALLKAGYGTIYADGRIRKAHGWSYEYHVGPVPEGLELDHLCRNRACVNPAHLEPVTHAENMRRSPIAPTGINAAKKFCDHGHPFAGENLRLEKNGSRVCKTCATAHGRAHDKKRGAVRSNLRKILRGAEPDVYEVQVRAGVLITLTHGMTHKQKSEYLWRFTNFERPYIGQDGLICVPDPNGSVHEVERQHSDGDDIFTCKTHRVCWAVHSAIRSYRLNTGIAYEESTGESIYLLPPTRGD